MEGKKGKEREGKERGRKGAACGLNGSILAKGHSHTLTASNMSVWLGILRWLRALYASVLRVGAVVVSQSLSAFVTMYLCICIFISLYLYLCLRLFVIDWTWQWQLCVHCCNSYLITSVCNQHKDSILLVNPKDKAIYLSNSANLMFTLTLSLSLAVCS